MAALPLVSLSVTEGFRPLVTLRAETPADLPAREALLDAAMGAGRMRKSSETIRRGRLPADGLSLVAEDEDGLLLGTVRLWHIDAGGVPALLLGPLAVRPGFEGIGIGGQLMRRAVAEARWRGHRAIVLVGDAPYYDRFGFGAKVAAGLAMPGPFERHRMLGLELEAGALTGANGVIAATGPAA
ncbi:GNAT family N-acetyltransferase [Aureimonas mangrovi]|uniref:GNAT family N-acetyltransferase n=1 Tax=Aureimonas mangrovi TaxID=2758041 RepID=UPI00163D4313|nr:N-acetyltransferase [Aureimonas mangrovi]